MELSQWSCRHLEHTGPRRQRGEVTYLARQDRMEFQKKKTAEKVLKRQKKISKNEEGCGGLLFKTKLDTSLELHFKSHFAEQKKQFGYLWNVVNITSPLMCDYASVHIRMQSMRVSHNTFKTSLANSRRYQCNVNYNPNTGCKGSTFACTGSHGTK